MNINYNSLFEINSYVDVKTIINGLDGNVDEIIEIND